METAKVGKRGTIVVPVRLRKQYGIVVAARASGTEGLDVDLRPGDVIYAINNEPTTCPFGSFTRLPLAWKGKTVCPMSQRTSG